MFSVYNGKSQNVDLGYHNAFHHLNWTEWTVRVTIKAGNYGLFWPISSPVIFMDGINDIRYGRNPFNEHFNALHPFSVSVLKNKP